MLVGVVYGTLLGAFHTPYAKAMASTGTNINVVNGRVMINSMLNKASDSGTALANKFGALTIFYCTLRSALHASTDLNDTWTVPLAGLLSGSLQSCHHRWRIILQQGVLGSAAFMVLDHSLKRSMANSTKNKRLNF
eukprot:Lankesteria_metandrocarpae@DN7418_c0_g1_i1.p1